MFRDSDIPQKHHHVTFTNKPNPDFQRVMEHSRFDDSSTNRRAQQHQQEEVIPTTWDSRYIPDHPDADYAGLVSKSHQTRRHGHDHSSQRSNIAHTDLGISGRDDFQLPRKRRENGPFNPITGEPIQQQPLSPLIAGPGDVRGTHHWKSSYQREIDEKQPTSRDMLTLKRQQELVGHGQPQPHLRVAAQAAAQAAYAQTSPRSARSGPMSYESRIMLAMDQARQNTNHCDENESITGTGGVARGGSMLSSLGSSLASRIPEFEANSELSHAARRSKVLMVENFGKHYKLDRK